MKTVIYRRPGWKPKTLNVVAENEDGSLDLADEAGQVVVRSCPLSEVTGTKKVAKKKVKGDK